MPITQIKSSWKGKPYTVLTSITHKIKIKSQMIYSHTSLTYMSFPTQDCHYECTLLQATCPQKPSAKVKLNSLALSQLTYNTQLLGLLLSQYGRMLPACYA